MTEETKSSTSKTAPSAKKSPEITYSQVLAKARSLVEAGKLTHSWIVEKLQEEDKKPADYKDEELKILDAELEEFLTAFEAANTAE
jgi:hypothetical protein